jgi:hypothetical protein
MSDFKTGTGYEAEVSDLKLLSKLGRLQSDFGGNSAINGSHETLHTIWPSA